MATACTPTPTATSTDVSTLQSFSTTSQVETTTLPGSVSTSIFRTCVPATATNVSTCVFTDATTFVTLPGNTSLVTVPVTVPIDIPITNIVTLFGQSCTTSPGDPTPPITTPSTTSPSDSVLPTSPVTTPSNTLFTLPDTTSNTSTPIFTPTTTTTTPNLPSTNTNTNTAAGVDNTSTTNHKKSNNAGAIAGGVVGGIAALLFLGILTWKLIKKQRRFDDIFNTDKPSNTPHYKKKAPETKPYDYGVIGQQAGHTTGFSPPSSPPATQTSFGGQQASTPYSQQAVPSAPSGSQAPGHIATSQGMGNTGAGQSMGHGGAGQGGTGQGVGHGGATGQGTGPNSVGQGVGNGASGPGQGVGHAPAPQPPQHLRNPSLTPLLAGIAVAATAGAANAAVASSSSSRPSTSSSLGPQVYPAQSQQGSMPGNSPGSSSASMYPPALQSWAAAQSSSMGQGAGAAGSSSLAHNASAGSTSTMYTSGTSSAGGAPYNLGNVPPMVPVVVGGAARNNHTQQLEQYADPFARSGSPVSLQEQRILQVTNADPSDSLYAPAGSSRQSYPGGSYFPNQGAASSSSSSSGPSPPSSGAAAVATDGKGRPLNLLGEKAPLVHLDGGLYQEPAPDAVPAPPAYSQ